VEKPGLETQERGGYLDYSVNVENYVREYYINALHLGYKDQEISDVIFKAGVPQEIISRVFNQVHKNDNKKGHWIWKTLFIVTLLLIAIVLVLGFIALAQDEEIVACTYDSDCPSDYQCIDLECLTTVGELDCAFYDSDSTYEYYQCVK
jgi:hypothetical protein